MLPGCAKQFTGSRNSPFDLRRLLDPKKLMFGSDWPVGFIPGYVEAYKLGFPKDHGKRCFTTMLCVFSHTRIAGLVIAAPSHPGDTRLPTKRKRIGSVPKTCSLQTEVVLPKELEMSVT